MTARPASLVVVTTPTDDEVETPLNVDAASITIGVSVVSDVLHPAVVAADWSEREKSPQQAVGSRSNCDPSRVAP